MEHPVCAGITIRRTFGPLCRDTVAGVTEQARTFPFPWLDPCESVRAQSNAHGHGRTPTSGRLNSPVRKLHKAVCRRFALKIRRCSPTFSSLSIGRSISTLLLYLPTLPDQTWKRFISVKYDLRFYLRILIFIASTLSPRVSESFGFYIFFFLYKYTNLHMRYNDTYV